MLLRVEEAPLRSSGAGNRPVSGIKRAGQKGAWLSRDLLAECRGKRNCTISGSKVRLGRKTAEPWLAHAGGRQERLKLS